MQGKHIGGILYLDNNIYTKDMLGQWWLVGFFEGCVCFDQEWKESNTLLHYTLLAPQSCCNLSFKDWNIKSYADLTRVTQSLIELNMNTEKVNEIMQKSAIFFLIV